MKTGRNAPCPCGSGKKYKHCCLRAETAAPPKPTDVAWHRLQRLLPDFREKLIRFIREAYGPYAIDEAWHEFMLWDDAAEEFDPESPHLPVFIPWFSHAWAPDPMGTTVRDRALLDLTPTAAFLARRAQRLDPTLRAYLESCLRSHFSFFEIVSCDPGQGLHLRDVITNADWTVVEHSASQSVTPGDLIYAQLGEVDGIVMLEGCSALSLPPIEKIRVIELREDLARLHPSGGDELVANHELDLRELYLEISSRLLEPTLPQLSNTDGDPLDLQRLVFDIESPQAAFDALKALALRDMTEDELLADAERDSRGNLHYARFGWTREGHAGHSGLSNTVLGFIEVEGTRLTVEVNSARRAQAIREIIASRLGDRARYRTTVHSALGPALASSSRQRETAMDDENSDDLNALPEVQAAVSQMLEQYYDEWVSLPVPALGNRSPLEAVRTPEGREMVEALVRQLERPRSAEMATSKAIVDKVRARLGLPSRSD